MEVWGPHNEAYFDAIDDDGGIVKENDDERFRSTLLPWRGLKPRGGSGSTPKDGQAVHFPNATFDITQFAVK